MSTENESNPRAFVTATGFIFQVVGMVLAAGGCVLWSVSGFLEAPLDEPINVLSDYAREGALARTVGLACIATTLIAGLGLIATGLGLQGERRTSGRWALVFAAVLAVVWCAGAICLWLISAPYWKVIVAAFFAGAGTILFLMAGNSARILKRHPPPDDQDAVSDEWLRQYSRKTDE